MPERDSNHVTIGHAGQANEAACVSEIATGHAEGGASKLIGEPADAHSGRPPATAATYAEKNDDWRAGRQAGRPEQRRNDRSRLSID